MKLRCQHILVTGGSSGIGLAIAKRFCELGAEVTICGRGEKKLTAARESIGSPHLHTHAWDITKISDFRTHIAEVEKEMGGFDGLVNAATVDHETAYHPYRGYEPWDIREEEWDAVADINLKATFFMMRNAVDYMVEKQTTGNVLNIASNAACMDITGPYSSSKLAILKMTRAFGKRFGSKGIIINGIAPGAVFTPLIRDYAHTIDQPYPRHAIGRFIRPDEIAELAYYLMSDFGMIVCGHTVVADGGDNAATL